jgi:hypothetical protein
MDKQFCAVFAVIELVGPPEDHHVTELLQILERGPERCVDLQNNLIVTAVYTPDGIQCEFFSNLVFHPIISLSI